MKPCRTDRPTSRTWPGAALAAVLLCVAAAQSLAYASSPAFAPRVTDADTTLVRVGQGTARYARLIPVYDAALYMERDAQAADILDAGIAKRLDIVYRVSIKAEDMITAAEHILARQHPEDVLARWRRELDALHAAYRDVQSGDRYALVFQPREGLWLEFNGERITRIAAEEFAQLYFGIWLGDEPLSDRLKQDLISHSPDRGR